MKIFSPDLIKQNYYALDKKNCLQEMVEFLFDKGVISSQQRFFNAIMARENTMSTGIGRNIAIPHARTDAVNSLKIAVYILDNELEFESIDDEPVKIVFMIAVPDDMQDEYRKLLSEISNFFRDGINRDRLLNAGSAEGVYNILKGIENEI